MSEATRIHIGHHFFGAGNIGDDLMLAGFKEALGATSERFMFTCCSPFRREAMAKRFPWITWLPYTLESRAWAIRSADRWLGLGDTPFQLDSGPWMAEHIEAEMALCNEFKKAVYFLGVGVNDAASVTNPMFAQAIGRAEHIWCRDDLCADYLRTVASASKVTVGADLAHCYLRTLTQTRTSDRIGLCLNFESREAFDLSVIEALCAAGGSCGWIVQDDRVFDWNESALFGLVNAETRQHLRIYVPNYNSGCVAELLESWPSFKTVVSSRYHAILVYAWRGSALAVVNRNEKLRGITEQLELPSTTNLCSVRSAVELLRNARPALRDTLDLLESCSRNCVSQWAGLMLATDG